MKTSFIDIVQVLIVMFGIIGVSYSMPKTIDTPVNICPFGTFECSQRCIDYSERCDGRFVICSSNESFIICLAGYESYRYSMSQVLEIPTMRCRFGKFDCNGLCKYYGQLCDGKVVECGPEEDCFAASEYGKLLAEEDSLPKCPDNYRRCREGCRTVGQICNGKILNLRITTTTTTTTAGPTSACGSNRFDCGGVCKDLGEMCDGREVW